MRKETITYTDYNGEKRTEDFYFNYSVAELGRMQLTSGGLEDKLRAVVARNDREEIITAFEDIILGSYGEKSEDGRRFIKVRNGEKLADAFKETEAYSVLFVKLLSDENALETFMKGIIPKNVDSVLPQGVENAKNDNSTSPRIV